MANQSERLRQEYDDVLLAFEEYGRITLALKDVARKLQDIEDELVAQFGWGAMESFTFKWVSVELIIIIDWLRDEDAPE